MTMPYFPDKPRKCSNEVGSHRQDGLPCAHCKKWVCAWHWWMGDDAKAYCPKCAPKHRYDMLPKGPTKQRKLEVLKKVAQKMGVTVKEVEEAQLGWFDMAMSVREGK